MNELLVRLKDGRFMHSDMRMKCLLTVGKFPNLVSWLIQWALHTVELWWSGLGLSVNPGKAGLLAFTRRGNFFRASSVWEDPTKFHVGQVPRNDPELTSDLEGTHGC